MRSPARLGTRLAVVSALVLYASRSAGAQTLPSEPIVLADGRVTVGGEVSATFAAEDTGYFDYTDYEHSVLRMLRVDVTAAIKAGDRVSLLGELRSENGDRPRPYALYVRIRPWATHAFDIQAGRVPPTFGAFPRRAYGTDNPLIGYPLAFQYLTSLRSDALPASADELLRMRGRGWRSSFSLGQDNADRGLPLVNVFRWDTGVQLHAAGDHVEATAAVTVGTLSNPLFKDDNDGRQVAGRLVVRPAIGLVLGASASQGPFVSRSAARAVPGGSDLGAYTQRALGGDVEFSRGYYLVRFETVFNEWTVPAARAPLIDAPLRALATSLEAKYKIGPGLYAAARLEHLGFSEITGTARRESWEAPLTRIEVGGGYSIQRNLLAKLAYQYNTRDGGRVRTLGLLAGQLQFWF